MTVTANTRRAGPFLGNGSATQFPFAFKLFAPGDLQLTHVSGDGDETVLVLDSHYSVSLNADQDASPGGVITYPLSGAPLTAGASLVGVGVLPVQQGTDLTNLGRFLPQVIENAFDYVTILIQQLQERVGRAIVVSPSAATDLADLPTADLAGKFITFDADGNPILTSGTGADAGLRTDLAQPTGSTLVGFQQAGAGAVPRTTRVKLRETVSVTDFGAVPGTDCTAAFQNAVNSNPGELYVPPGVYYITEVTLANTILIRGCGDASVLKTPDDYCGPTTGPTRTSIFQVTAHNISVSIHSLKFDGNEQNQTVPDPQGGMIRASFLPGGAGQNLAIECNNVTFANPTDYAVRLDGNLATAGSEIFRAVNCRWVDGREGLPYGSPLTLNSGGFSCDYIRVTDQFKILIDNCSFVFHKVLAADRYAPLGCRLTFSDGSGSNADGASASFSNCYFYRVGRASSSGNGLGCVDAYAKGRNISVTGCTFENTLNSGVRGKSNADSYSIIGNNFSDCVLPIDINGATSGDQKGLISIIGNNITRTVGDFAISVIGDTTDNRLDAVTIANNNIYDPEKDGAYDGNDGAILMRYVDTATISGNVCFNVGNGIKCRDVSNLSIVGNMVRGCAYRGIWVDGGTGDFAVANNVVRSCTSYGIFINIGTDAEVVFTGNLVTNVGEYGIRADAYKVAFMGNSVNGVTGAGRSYYASATSILIAMIGNSSVDATNPYIDGGSPPTRAYGNSWEPQNDFATSAPSSGTFAKGDKVWNTNPSAGGTAGWICTTAGTPGTWKTFGTIAA